MLFSWLVIKINNRLKHLSKMDGDIDVLKNWFFGNLLKLLFLQFFFSIFLSIHCNYLYHFRKNLNQNFITTFLKLPKTEEVNFDKSKFMEISKQYFRYLLKYSLTFSSKFYKSFSPK